MATPITHMILTDKIYEERFIDCDKKEFILWTLLPDIRYFDKDIPRESTHIQNVSLNTIKSLTTCFDKWLHFHSLVDHIRDEFYVSRWIYIPGGDEDFIMALKLLEDQYLYPKVKNRDEYIKFFDDIPYEKITNIRKESLDKWYAIIKQETISGPNDISRREFQTELWLSKEYTDRINGIIHKLQDNEKILHLIDEFYESFWSLISK